MKRTYYMLLILSFALVITIVVTAQTNDPLPSWNEGATKQAITNFVNDVTTAGGSRYVPLAQRIATFDNDGTLWAEQVIGSTIKTEFELRDGTPVLVRLPELNLNVDKDGKPVGKDIKYYLDTDVLRFS